MNFAVKNWWSIRENWRTLGCFDIIYLKIVQGLPFFSLFLSTDGTEVSVEMAGTHVSATNSHRGLPKATVCFLKGI